MVVVVNSHIVDPHKLYKFTPLGPIGQVAIDEDEPHRSQPPNMDAVTRINEVEQYGVDIIGGYNPLLAEPHKRLTVVQEFISS